MTPYVVIVVESDPNIGAPLSALTRITCELALYVAREVASGGYKVLIQRTAIDPAVPGTAPFLMEKDTGLDELEWPNHHIVFLTPGVRPATLADTDELYTTGAGNVKVVHVRLMDQPSSTALPVSGLLQSILVEPRSYPGTEPTRVVEPYDPDGASATALLDRTVCRVALSINNGVVASSWQGANIPAHYQKTFERWARALTGRRVGLALSGGGATSYYHLALLDHLGTRTEPVPIDVISGESGGALLGAYWAAANPATPNEIDELTRAYRDQGAKFFGMCLLALGGTQWFKEKIDADLGFQRIQDLEIPFAPIAVRTSWQGAPPNPIPETVIVKEGTIGRGVQISSGLAGVFPRTRLDQTTYLDGGFGNFIPVSALTHYGADIWIASDTSAQPDIVKYPEPLTRLTDILDAIAVAQKANSRLANNSVAYFQMEPIGAVALPALQTILLGAATPAHLSLVGADFLFADKIYERSHQQLLRADLQAKMDLVNTTKKPILTFP